MPPPMSAWRRIADARPLCSSSFAGLQKAPHEPFPRRWRRQPSPRSAGLLPSRPARRRPALLLRPGELPWSCPSPPTDPSTTPPAPRC
eukprot:13352872-Alexandrium_andersonii.AAC.1